MSENERRLPLGILAVRLRALVLALGETATPPEASKRLLSTVVLPIFIELEPGIPGKFRKVFENRNAVAHGKKHKVTREEAEEAIEAATTANKMLVLG